MLKLEKTRRSEIIVKIRDQQNFLNKPFFYALGIAIALHILPALLFYISPFIITGEIILPPVFVETDLNFSMENDHSAVAYLEQERGPPKYSLEPSLSEPKISMISSMTSDQIDDSSEKRFTENPFIIIEENWEEILGGNCIKTPPPPIRCQISGKLSEQQILDDGLNKVPFVRLEGDYIVSYDVRVEGKSGKIFWYALKQSSLPPMVKNTAETILKEMLFKPNPEIFVQDGIIEFMFVNRKI